MRREGRQHGAVVTFGITPHISDLKRPDPSFRKLVNGPFMGIFKAPAKPTNGSRYTSRCRKPRCQNCHSRPAAKAKAKTKGNHKHKDEAFKCYFYEGPCEQCCVSDDPDMKLTPNDGLAAR